MTAHPDNAWVEFDPVALERPAGALLWFVGRDERGSPIMHTDSTRVVDLVAVTFDQAEARRAHRAMLGEMDQEKAA